jgi:hypothetical protein
LRKIHKNPGFTAGSQVKISRSAVTMTRILTDLSIRSDFMLRRLFASAARGLPVAPLSATRRTHFAQPGLRTEFDPKAGEPNADEQFAAREAEPLRRRSYGSSGS